MTCSNQSDIYVCFGYPAKDIIYAQIVDNGTEVRINAKSN